MIVIHRCSQGLGAAADSPSQYSLYLPAHEVPRTSEVFEPPQWRLFHFAKTLHSPSTGHVPGFDPRHATKRQSD